MIILQFIIILEEEIKQKQLKSKKRDNNILSESKRELNQSADEIKNEDLKESKNNMNINSNDYLTTKNDSLKEMKDENNNNNDFNDKNQMAQINNKENKKKKIKKYLFLKVIVKHQRIGYL